MGQNVLRAIKSKWPAIVNACGEVFITFSPILVLFLVLGIFGELGKIIERADVSFVMAVLFADGSWRSVKTSEVPLHERAAILAFGIVGAMLCTASATVLLLVELSVVPTKEVLFVTANLGYFNIFLYIIAFLYSIIVRVETF